jgi:hypothetical protein
MNLDLIINELLINWKWTESELQVNEKWIET